MRFVKTAMMGLAALALMGAPALAAKLTVPSDDYPTIQSAVDAAESGDTIVVKSGTYDETVYFDEKSGITLKGSGKPVITGGDGTGIDLRDCHDITVTGFVFRTLQWDGVYLYDCLNVTIAKCMFEDIGDVGIRTASGESLEFVKNTFTGIESYCIAIEAGEPGPASDVEVSKNKMIGDIGNGVFWRGEGHVIEKNTLQGVDGLGLVGFDSDDLQTRISKNKLTDIGDDAICSTGDGDLVEKNKVDGVESAAIRASGDGSVVTKNKVSNVDGEAFEVEGENIAVSKNKVSGAVIGFRCNSEGCTYDKNKVTGATQYGFLVSRDNNVLTKNSAKGSGLFDLHDNTGGSTNQYVKNKFGTENFDE